MSAAGGTPASAGRRPAGGRRGAAGAAGASTPAAAAAIAGLGSVGPPLSAGFYAQPVPRVARELLGCVLIHGACAGLIVETEAYHHSEPACHAYVGVTQRTRTLFGAPGNAYVYRSYGIHSLFNVVCEPTGVGAAVLIRALEPLAGLELMRRRRLRGGSVRGDHELCAGPGRLSVALAIDLRLNGTSLLGGPVAIHRAASANPSSAILSGPRVGISKATELPWRFCLAGNRHVSRPRLSP